MHQITNWDKIYNFLIIFIFFFAIRVFMEIYFIYSIFRLDKLRNNIFKTSIIFFLASKKIFLKK